MNSTSKIFNDYCPSKATVMKAASVICAIPAAEMAIRAVGELAKDAVTRDSMALSRHAGGAVFMGLMAANFIPGTAMAGLGLLGLYSIFPASHGDYVTADFAFDKVIKPLGKHVIEPLFHHIINPVIRLVRDIVVLVVSTIFIVLNKVSMPKHPIWIGVTVLALAILGYKALTKPKPIV